MQKNWIWIVIAVIVVALLAYFVLGRGGALSTLGNTSLRSLLTSNATQECQFDNGSSSGTLYVSAGRMRGDFTAKDSAAAQSHMVIANDIAYLWIDGSSQGYRMPFENLTATSSTQASGGIDADAKVASKCESWSATDATFALPTDVSFNPVGAPAGDMTPTTTGSTQTSVEASSSQSYYAQQCAACGAITDPEAKAQCVASFDCPAQ